jgi:hypothetical protein
MSRELQGCSAPLRPNGWIKGHLTRRAEMKKLVSLIAMVTAFAFIAPAFASPTALEDDDTPKKGKKVKKAAKKAVKAVKKAKKAKKDDE